LDHSILDPSDIDPQLADLDLSTSAAYLTYFDSYCSNNIVELFWKTDTTTIPHFPFRTIKRSDFGKIRIYKSESGPDEDFYLVHESSKVGDDFLVLENLENNTMYYFRLATYSSKDSLLGVSKPLMTAPGFKKNAIYELNINQVEDPSYIKNLSWSPTENNLAFIMADQILCPNLYILNIGSFIMKKISAYSSDNHRLMGVNFSPDGIYTAYSYTASSTFAKIDYRIWTVNLADNSILSITSGRVDSDPDWFSHDSILFCKGTYDPPNIPQLYIKNLIDETETIIPVDENIYKYTPDVYPGDGSIVYSGEYEYSRSIYHTNIWGDYNQNLTNSKFWKDIHPHWSVDGENVLFTSNRSGHFEIWSINIFTKKYRQITRGLQYGQNRFYGKISFDQNYMAVIEYNQEMKYILKILQN
jgi:hypothetical protein